LGAVLSGAGPSVLALADPSAAPAVAAALAETAAALGTPGEVVSLSPVCHGAHVIEEQDGSQNARSATVLLTGGQDHLIP
ncbi:MAG: hypothetical protein M3Q03_10375, partial [Chloroflexota bacterium]|nr:hypothetical protein [Chloroflexota bacterium]